MVKVDALTAFGLLSLTGQAIAQSVKVMPFGASIVTVCYLTLPVTIKLLTLS